MDSFSYLKVYIYSWYNIESLGYNLIAYIHHNCLKFDDTKQIKKIMKIIEYFCHIDVNFKTVSNNFFF